MDFNNFGPFNSEVWGSTSDVIIAISTVVATVGLLSTLGKQISINREALETSRIAMRPHFILKDGSVGFIKLICENAHAVNLKIPKHGSILKNDIIQEYVFNKEVINFDVNFRFKITENLPVGYILITLFFEDEIGRKYKQTIKTTNDRPIISHPILITK
ncbi:hypothetical protein [Pedobacter panaciterrae]